MALTTKALELALNKNPRQIVFEQVAALYGRLYPFMVNPVNQDFISKPDLDVAFASILLELQQIKLLLQTHIHATPGAPTSVPIPPVSPSVVPNPFNAAGNAKVLIPPASDPVGASFFLPTHIAFPAAIPPIDPTIL